MKKDKEKFEDDGRQIADMSYTHNSWSSSMKRLKSKKTQTDQEEKEITPMSKKDTRKFIFYAVLTALGIGMVFAVGFFLFIQFCINVWFK